MSARASQRLIAAAALATLLLGCFIGCRPDQESPTEESAVSGTEPSGSPPLREVPEPELGAMEEVARKQLEDARARLERAQEQDLPARELAGTFAELGSLYQAYGLDEPAVAALSNALALAPDEHRPNYQLALLELAAGDFEEAARRLERVLELEPDSAPARYRLARLRLDQGRPEEARSLLEELLAKHPNEPAVHFELGRAAAALDESQAALEHFERVLELEPEAGRASYLLGLTYRRMGRETEAAAAFARQGAREPSFPDPLLAEVQRLAQGTSFFLRQGDAAMLSGHPDDAVALYERAVRSDPRSPEARQSLGFALADTGDLDAAEEQYRRALELRPESPSLHLNLGDLLLRRGQLESARAHFAEAVALDPRGKETRLGYALALERAGDLDGATEQVDALLALDPGDPHAIAARARMVAAAGGPDEALDLLQRALSDQPRSPTLRAALGDHLADLGRLEEAASEYQQALGLPIEEPALRARLHANLGRIASRTNEREQAVRQFEAALEELPGDPAIRRLLADTLAGLGRYRSAIGHYRELLASRPDSDETRLLAATALMLDQRAGEARELLREGLERSPESPGLRNALARLLATAPDAALREPKRALELARSVLDREPTLEHGETLAMALAAVGELEEAISWQEQLVARAREAGEDAWVARLESNLARYRRGEIGAP